MSARAPAHANLPGPQQAAKSSGWRHALDVIGMQLEVEKNAQSSPGTATDTSLSTSMSNSTFNSSAMTEIGAVSNSVAMDLSRSQMDISHSRSAFLQSGQAQCRSPAQAVEASEEADAEKASNSTTVRERRGGVTWKHGEAMARPDVAALQPLGREDAWLQDELSAVVTEEVENLHKKGKEAKTETAETKPEAEAETKPLQVLQEGMAAEGAFAAEMLRMQVQQHWKQAEETAAVAVEEAAKAEAQRSQNQKEQQKEAEETAAAEAPRVQRQEQIEKDAATQLPLQQQQKQAAEEVTSIARVGEIATTTTQLRRQNSTKQEREAAREAKILQKVQADHRMMTGTLPSPRASPRHWPAALSSSELLGQLKSPRAVVGARMPTSSLLSPGLGGSRCPIVSASAFGPSTPSAKPTGRVPATAHNENAGSPISSGLPTAPVVQPQVGQEGSWSLSFGNILGINKNLLSFESTLPSLWKQFVEVLGPEDESAACASPESKPSLSCSSSPRACSPFHGMASHPVMALTPASQAIASCVSFCPLRWNLPFMMFDITRERDCSNCADAALDRSYNSTSSGDEESDEGEPEDVPKDVQRAIRRIHGKNCFVIAVRIVLKHRFITQGVA